ncbi:uncharacterized protein LOC134694548 [Mytilus trossulus]|uniref:uncharacterized protein LOC134694548 n=1 Tax=Mytilus trossulus TaxID=6551 RepID=UPI0030075608
MDNSSRMMWKLAVIEDFITGKDEVIGYTALHIAVNHRYTDIVKLLIDGGIDLNINTRAGNTVLHVAAEQDPEMVKSLINNYSDPNIPNDHGKRPIEVANSNVIVRLIKDYENTLVPGLPAEVKKFDKKSARVFSSLLEEESYRHFESRVMLAGEQGTGKTTIARHLVGKQPTKFRMSTDGIELYNGLSFMDIESNCWRGGQQDFTMEELTITRSLIQDETLKKGKSNVRDKKGISQHTLDKEDTPLSASETPEKTHETHNSHSSDSTAKWSDFGGQLSNTTSKTESLNDTFRPNHHLLNKHVNPDGELKQLSDDQSEHKEIKENRDSSCGVGMHDSSHARPVSPSSRSVEDSNLSDYLINVDEPNTYDLPATQEPIDAFDDKYTHEVLYDEETSTSVPDYLHSESGFTGDVHIETVTKPVIIRKLKKIFGISKKVKEVKVSITKEKFFEKSVKVGKKLLHNKNIAPIIIWDFGGQDVFYSTHQTFLTYRAIYIIVLDGSRKLDDPCPTEQYLPGKSGQKTAKDYLLFWINTIVTYCKGSVKGFPRIIIVLTHKDKLDPNEIEQRRMKVFEEIKHMFLQTPFMQHLVIEDQIFVNAKDKRDPELAKLKNIIISESKMQPTWGEPLPKCFIPLELEFASLIKRGIPLITLEHLQKINSLQPIRSLTESELTVFLKFQHAVGKVLYFDEKLLDHHVILSPTHLIDAFKSIVTDRRFCEGDKEREELWDVMGKKGVVSKKAIQKIWKKHKYKKFYKDKDYLLEVMTHLDILVEPKRYDLDRHRIPADFYYVASMVRAHDDSGYLQSAGFTTRSIAIAFQSSSLMIPPALSFRFISYCLYVWAVKKYGDSRKEMLFHRSGFFTIDSSLDMYIACEDERIIVRLVHATSNTLIMRDVASSIYECLTSALEKISQLYIRTSSDQTQTSDASFVTRICCNSPNNSCVLPDNDLAHTDQIWICPSHGIEHSIHTITSWIEEKKDEKCKPGCTVTKDEFLKATPLDIHLRRLSLLYSPFEAKELAIHLGLSNREVNVIEATADPLTASFAILLRCRDSRMVTFKDIREAIESIGKENMEPEKWDMVPTAEHIDRLAPLVGKYSLPFLIELGMDLNTWEQISHRQHIRDLVRLNQDILEEWRFKFLSVSSCKHGAKLETSSSGG